MESKQQKFVDKVLFFIRQGFTLAREEGPFFYLEGILDGEPCQVRLDFIKCIEQYDAAYMFRQYDPPCTLEQLFTTDFGLDWLNTLNTKYLKEIGRPFFGENGLTFLPTNNK